MQAATCIKELVSYRPKYLYYNVISKSITRKQNKTSQSSKITH